MLSRLISKLTYSNVVATVALFLAMGGGLAWALANNSVKSKHIKDGQVKSDDVDDAVESLGFGYTAATGDDLQEEILDVDGYRVLAACDDEAGKPSLEIFLAFPEDGRLNGSVVRQKSTEGVGNVGTGPESTVDGGTTVDAGSLTPDASEIIGMSASFSYIADTKAATLTLHEVASDDADQCQLTGVLIPGIIPPA